MKVLDICARLQAAAPSKAPKAQVLAAGCPCASDVHASALDVQRGHPTSPLRQRGHAFNRQFLADLSRHAGCFGELMLLAENRSSSPTLLTQRWSCQRLPDSLRAELVAFARSTMPATDAEAYLTPRWDAYPELQLARDHEGVRAFALLHPFIAAGERHLYVGPMFSRGRAYVELFAEMVQTLLDAPGRRTFHVAAEIEHPAVLRAFATLLPSCAAPQGRGASESRVAARFGSHVPHVAGLDLANLRTQIDVPLFRAICDGPNHAQLVLVSWYGDAESRRHLQRQLSNGLNMLRRA